MTDPRHARILANIARQVVEQYTTTRSGVTPDADKGNVPVPHRTQVLNALGFTVVHDSWNYTLPERYQA